MYLCRKDPQKNTKNVMETNEIYAERLEKKGVKPTAVRILVLKAMMEASCAVSLIELETMLATVDRSTIFRTLNLFLAHHLVHDIEDGSGSLKYEVCPDEDTCSVDDMHTHFYCEVCHRTFCFRSIHIPVIDLPEGFRLNSINYMVKGVCRECAARMK